MKIQTARRERIEELLDENSIARETNEYETPKEPELLLAIEYSDGEDVWAYGGNTLAEIAQSIDLSETSRTSVIVHNLDTGEELWPIVKTVGFLGRTDEKGLYRVDLNGGDL
jgi:hypothetical protein